MRPPALDGVRGRPTGGRGRPRSVAALSLRSSSVGAARPRGTWLVLEPAGRRTRSMAMGRRRGPPATARRGHGQRDHPRGGPGPARRRAGHPRGATGAVRHPRRAGGGRVHDRRLLPRSGHPGPSGSARRGDARQPVGGRRRRPPLARRRRPERGGRRRGHHAGRGPGRGPPRVPVRRHRRRDVLVPLAPDVARAGRARTPRAARRRPGRRTARGRRPVGAAPPVCGSAHPERPGRGRARRRPCGVDGPRPGGQHRPGHRRRLVLRSVPGGRDRRPRRHRPDGRDRPFGPRRRRWPGRRRGPDAGRRVRDPAAARGPQHGHRAGGDVGARRAAAEGLRRPHGVRLASTHRHRHGASRPDLRVCDRPAVRAAGRAPGQLVDDQRPALPRRPDVPRPPRGRRRRSGSRTGRTRCTPCTCTATTSSS